MMKNIGSLWRSFVGGKASKEDARSRLQFVLVQDRAGMSSDEMSKFKAELIGVIEKYFKLESEKFDITYKREGDGTMLLINSPVQVRRSSSNSDSKNGNDKKKAANH